MCQTHNLRVVLHSGGAFLFSDLELTLLKSSDVRHTHGLAECSEDIAFSFIYCISEGVNTLLQVIVGLLCLYDNGLGVTNETQVQNVYPPQLWLNLFDTAIDMPHFVLDACQAEPASTLDGK